MVLKSVGVVSVAKIMGTLCAIMGFLFGLVFAMLSVVGAGFAETGSEGLFAVMFGVGGVIILPIFYGVFGFIQGLIVSVIYNFLAGIVGGVELNLQ